MNKIIKFYLHKVTTSYFNYIILVFLFMVLIVVNLVSNISFEKDIYTKNGNDFINTPIYFTTLVSLIINIIFALILAVNIYHSNDSWFHSDLIMMTKVKNRNAFILGRMLSLFILIIISSLLISLLSFIAGFIFHDSNTIDGNGIEFKHHISMWSRIKQMFSNFIFNFLIIVIFSLLAIILTLFFKTLIAFISFIFIVFAMVGISIIATNAYTKKDFAKSITDYTVKRKQKEGNKEQFFKNNNSIYQYKTGGYIALSKNDIDTWEEDQKKSINFGKTYNRYLDPIGGLLELNHLFLNSRYQMKTEKYYGETFLKTITRLETPRNIRFPFTLKEIKMHSNNIKVEYNHLIKKIKSEDLATMNLWLKNILPDRSAPMNYIGFKKLLVDLISLNKPSDEKIILDLYLEFYDINDPQSSLHEVNYDFTLLSNLGPWFKNIYESQNHSSKDSFTRIRFLNDVLNDPIGTYTKYKNAYDEYVIPHYVTETYEYMDIKLPTRYWMFIYIPLIFLTTSAILIYEKKRNFN